MERKECKLILVFDPAVVSPEKLIEIEQYINCHVSSLLHDKFKTGMRVHI